MSLILPLQGEERAGCFSLSSWCLVMVERVFLALTLGCLRFVIVVFPDHTHLLFLQVVVMSVAILVIFISDNSLT